MAVNQRGSGQRAIRRDRGDRGGTDGALSRTARPDRNHQGPHQLPLVASGGMTLKNSSAGFGITEKESSKKFALLSVVAFQACRDTRGSRAHVARIVHRFFASTPRVINVSGPVLSRRRYRPEPESVTMPPLWVPTRGRGR